MPFSLAGVRYVELNYPFKTLPRDEAESFSYVKLPTYTSTRSSHRILFVLDYVPKEDLHSGNLLSGEQGEMLSNLINKIAEPFYLKRSVNFSWLACSFNAVRTAGKSSTFVKNATAAFEERIKFMIGKYKPDMVVTFGEAPMRAFYGKELELTKGKVSPWLGVIRTKKIGDHKVKFCATVSLNTLTRGKSGEQSFSGYVARNLANAISGHHLFAVDTEKLASLRPVLIDTVEKFDKLLAKLKDEPVVAVDTETANLNRIVNKLLSIQFSKCANIGYFIPLEHKDSPFLKKELKYIKKELRKFFEGANNNKCHVYANGGFDLNQLKVRLGVRHFANDIWDIFAGEYCFHPDTLVCTEDGPIKIKDLVASQVKPKVLSFNHATQKEELKEVLFASEHPTLEDLYEVEYEGGKVRITGNDKIWSVTRNSYVRVDELRVDEDVLSGPSILAKIKAIRKIADSPTVCSLTIKDNHNLFVKDAVTNLPILCHNCLDENKKQLQGITGDYYYSLGNIAVQYGFTGYLTAKFGKADRATIEQADLNEDLVKYGVLDVCVPFAIRERQLAVAKQIGHIKYERLVSKQMSDMIHGFSVMEVNGNLIDVNYLFYLKTPQSPIENEIRKMTKELYDSPAIKTVNKILQKQKGISSNGLFGKVDVNLFSLGTNEHKQILFFKVLELEPLKKGDGGAGKLDKVFQKTYADVPEVAMFTAISKAGKLRNAYVNSFIRLLGTSADLQHDKHIRSRYNYLDVVTGRTSASDPNLQQVPTHSELGKHIKRLFIAPEGTLDIKVDYRVHEVRGWGLISFDKAIAALFINAKKLRDAYRRKPSPELAKRVKLEADVHVMNASYFFSTAVEKVDKPLRNAVKGVIFGLIYQMSMKSLAKTLGKTMEFTENLVKNFRKRFPKGMGWIVTIKELARKNFYVESPIGLRRYLWGYIVPKRSEESGRIIGEMDRRAVNSPIQGMCSQFMSIGARALDKLKFKILIEEGRDLKLKVRNSVHDSLETTSGYETLLENLGHIETSLTTKVSKIVAKRVGFNFVVDLEIDFEIGASLGQTVAWDCSLDQLEEICYESLMFQKTELKYDLDVDEVLNEIFVKGWKRAPSWIKEQSKVIGWSPSSAKKISKKLAARAAAEEAKKLEEKKKQEKSKKKEKA